MGSLGEPQLNAQTGHRTLHRRVLDMAGPVIGENFLETFMSVVDTLMVGQLGAAAIAGVGSALQIMFFIIAALGALAVGSAVLVAQAFGAKRLDQANHLARQSLIWSVIFAIPLVIIGVLFVEPIIGVFGMEAEASQIGVDYLRITLVTSAILTTSLIGGGILRGVGDSRSPMIVRAIANLLNVVLTYGLIFGQLGLPEIGVMGSAWGTFYARLFGLILLLIIMWRGRHGLSLKGSNAWWPEFKTARKLLQIGLPAAVEQFLISCAFLVFTIIVASLGTATLAGHRLALIAMSLSFMPGMGFGMAATSLVGQSIGAQRPEEASSIARISTMWAVWWMGIMGLVMFLFPDFILQWFIADSEVIASGVGALRMIALVQPFWGIFMVQSGALRGLGNTQFPMWSNTIGMWLNVSIAYLFTSLFDPYLALLWTSFSITSPFMAGLLIWRFRWSIQQNPSTVISD